METPATCEVRMVIKAKLKGNFCPRRDYEGSRTGYKDPEGGTEVIGFFKAKNFRATKIHSILLKYMVKVQRTMEM
jgi:hypothetical protein